MKVLQYTLYGTLIVSLVVAVATILVLRQPQFGKAPFGDHLAQLKQSPHHDGEAFVNQGGVALEMGSGKLWDMLAGYWSLPAHMRPTELPIMHPDVTSIASHGDSLEYITWFGHSSFLFETDDLQILLDPMLGPAASPFAFSVQRFSDDLPISLDDMPFIDVVIYSHDHYDHLDYPTVMALKDSVGHFFVPLGLKSHLVHWGVSDDQVTELDWWDSIEYKGLTIHCTPSQHFSGRGLTDRGATLWASWVIETRHGKLYFSGDSGYFDGFKEIGKRLGPFDLALLECGQYNELWKPIHMMPEETAQAALDLRASNMIPIHWGMFELALHPWKEPVERVSTKAEELGVNMLTPVIGERLALTSQTKTSSWWKAIE